MTATCPTSPRGSTMRIALGAARAGALASATDVAFATYFGVVLALLAMPQLATCLRAATTGKR